MKRIVLFALVALAIPLGYLVLKDNAYDNDILFYGGTVLTMNDKRPSAEAVLVKRGKIVEVGTRADLLKHATPDTEQRDLQGRTLMPGFFDAHGHVDIATVFYSMVDVSGFSHRTAESVWDEIHQATRSKPAGEWIWCYGYDPILTAGLKVPSIAFLDSLASVHPLVIISSTLHFYYANTQAFNTLGITDTTVTENESGYYEKDPSGKLTGLIVEQEAFEPFRKKLQEKLLNSFASDLQKQMSHYASRGITSMVTMGLTTANSNIVMLFRHLSAEHSTFLSNALELAGKLPAREVPLRHFVYLRDRDASLLPASPREAGDDFFRIAGIKTWYDGSPYVGSMYLTEPYVTSKYMQQDLHLEPDHRGGSLLSPAELEALIEKYQSRGWPLAVHAQGDQAVHEVVTAFAGQGTKHQERVLRNRIEHCLLLPKEEVGRIAETPGLSVSFHINHILYYGDFLRSEVVGKRTDAILPVRTVRDSSIVFSLHADNPMFDANPLSLVSTAVVRNTESGHVIGREERIQLYDALKAVTIHPAWQVGMDDKLGTIESGKYADLVILSANPYTVPPKEISTIEVLETIVAGNTIWKKD